MDFIALQEAMFEYKAYPLHSRQPLVTESDFPEREIAKRLSLSLNTNFLTYIYWNNRIDGFVTRWRETGNAEQFRGIGWNFEVGVRAAPFLYVEYEHHSQHLLDIKGQRGFPVEDMVGFKLFFFNAKPEEGLLNL